MVTAMADSLRKAQEVEKIVSKLVQRDVQLNKKQCELLHSRFKDTLKEVKEGTTSFCGSHRSMVILEEVLAVARRVECIVRDCCSADYVIAAIKAIDSWDRFVKLFVNLDFCCVLVKSLNMECGMSRHEIRNYDWEGKLNLVQAEHEVCYAANKDKEEIIGVMKELVDEKKDHGKVCQSLLNRLVDSVHTSRVEQSQHPPDFKEKEVLENQGGQATVFQAKWKGQCFVLKEFIFQRNQDKTFENEAKVLERLCHPNILNMVCHYTIPGNEDTERGIIVTEKMSKDLQSFLQDGETSALGTDHLCLPPLETVDIMVQIAEGLNYLHNITPKAVAHRDVKPRNILVTLNPLVVKVGDFGLAKVKSSLSNSEQTLNKGTTKFLAPELFPEVLSTSFSRVETKSRKWWRMGSKSTRGPLDVAWDQHKFKVRANNLKGDVYSFGITCSVILCGHEPYNDINYGEVRSAVIGGRRPELPSATPVKLRSLLEQCWHEDPDKRPSFSQIGKELRKLNAEMLLERLQDCPLESDEDYVRRTLQSVHRLQSGPSRILVIGESEHDKKTLIDHVCGGGDNNNNIGGNNDNEERKGSLLPMWMHKGRDQVGMIKQVQVALANAKTRNKIWTVESIYNLWSVSNKPLTLSDRNHTPLRDCGVWFHMLWLVYHVGRTSPKFEWRLVASGKQKHLIPVQLLVMEDVEEDPRGDKFYAEFMSRIEYLFPGVSEQELGERILKINADEDIRIRLWVACNVVQIRAEMQFAVGIMSRIGKKLGPKGITQIKSFAEHFTREQVVCKSASFAFEVFCSLFEVPVDFREALEERVKSWSPKIGISAFQAGTPPPNSFMHYCVWVVAVIVYSKSLRPGGWSSFECTRGQYPWREEFDECVDSHLLDLHEREWKVLVDKRKTYKFLTNIFEDTRVRGAKHRNSTLPIAPMNPLSHDQSNVSGTETSRRLHGAMVPPEIPPISDYEAPAPLWFSFRGLCPTLIYPLLRILRLYRP